MTAPPNVMLPTVAVAGYRGTAFVTGLIATGLRPARVISYRQVGDRSGAFERLSELCRAEDLEFEESRRPNLSSDRLVLLVGWQFLTDSNLDNCIVIHDSLLPKLRGFSPTVTALLTGDTAIGITAFRPVAGADAGPICGSRTVDPIGCLPASSLRSANRRNGRACARACASCPFWADTRRATK